MSALNVLKIGVCLYVVWDMFAAGYDAGGNVWPVCYPIGVDPGVERWREIAAVSEEHLDHHVSGLYDGHFMLAACASQSQEMSNKLLESMKNSIK